MTFFTKLISALTIMPTMCLLLACADQNELALKEPQSKILSAYHGLDALPAGANVICPIAVEGEDGMPVVFSVQIDWDSVMANTFENYRSRVLTHCGWDGIINRVRMNAHPPFVG